MGKVNDVMLEYLDDNERFADLFNGDFFHGEQVVRSEELMEGSQVYMEDCHDPAENSSIKRKTITRTRDIKKKLRNGGVLRILAIENQEHVNYAMPWRHMNYDCLEYGKQIRNYRKKNKKEKLLKTSAEELCGLRKQDRIAPTYTICVYHGTEKWDGPRSLKDMMDFGENGERWADLFADYQMHLICVNEITDFSRFHTPLREFLQLLSCREDKEALNKLLLENPAFESIDEETAKAASVLMGVEMHMEKCEGKETYSMCKAFQDHWNDGREIGRSEGKNEGLIILGNLFKRLNQDGRMEDWMRALEDNNYRDQLLQEYGLMNLKETNLA